MQTQTQDSPFNRLRCIVGPCLLAVAAALALGAREGAASRQRRNCCHRRPPPAASASRRYAMAAMFSIPGFKRSCRVLGLFLLIAALLPATASAQILTLAHESQGAINGNQANAVGYAGRSTDGSKVFFTTIEQLASTDTDTSQDLYMRENGVTTHISQGAINGNGVFSASYVGISADGSKVFFTTNEQLASTDTDTQIDIYQRENGVTTHISQGAINGNGPTQVNYVGVSSDGSRVFFTT
ncbi:MAG: hypothetical protein ACT6T0_13960, partial [Nevskia sp.]